MSAVLELWPADRERLTKLLGLLGSQFSGERDAAVLAATRILDCDGLKWHEILSLPHAPKREPRYSTWRTTCGRLRQRTDDLRPWEWRFVADLPAFLRISSKQRYLLAGIAARVFGTAAA